MQPVRCSLRAMIAATLMLVMLGSSASAQQGHSPWQSTPVAGATPPGGGAWEIVSRQDLEIDGQAVTLSPDGRWIAGLGPDWQICVWTVDTLEPTCGDEAIRPHDVTITWAPDSSAVAFSLNAVYFFEESDIFVFDVATGTTTNLTDDGVEGGLIMSDDEGPETLPIDFMPVWSRDSQSLSFPRIDWMNREGQTEIMTISRHGGEPVRRHLVDVEYLWSIVFPMFELADGSLLYPVTLNELGDPDNGIWRLDPNGEAVQVMPGAATDAFPNPAITGVLETDAGTIVTGYSVSRQSRLEPGVFTLDLATGQAGLATGLSGLDELVAPMRPSPDGASAIWLQKTGDSAHLVIAGPSGVSDLGVFGVFPSAMSRGIDWASNNTIMMMGTEGTVILVTVAPAAGAAPEILPPCSCAPPEATAPA